jgi:hypothetical protein
LWPRNTNEEDYFKALQWRERAQKNLDWCDNWIRCSLAQENLDRWRQQLLNQALRRKIGPATTTKSGIRELRKFELVATIESIYHEHRKIWTGVVGTTESGIRERRKIWRLVGTMGPNAKFLANRDIPTKLTLDVGDALILSAAHYGKECTTVSSGLRSTYETCTKLHKPNSLKSTLQHQGSINEIRYRKAIHKSKWSTRQTSLSQKSSADVTRPFGSTILRDLSTHQRATMYQASPHLQLKCTGNCEPSFRSALRGPRPPRGVRPGFPGVVTKLQHMIKTDARSEQHTSTSNWIRHSRAQENLGWWRHLIQAFVSAEEFGPVAATESGIVSAKKIGQASHHNHKSRRCASHLDA